MIKRIHLECHTNNANFIENNQLTDTDWKYQSEPSENENCCGWHKERRLNMPRGSNGGSGVFNYMMWVRGLMNDWNDLMNVDGWKWDDVLPFLKKSNH